MKSIVDTLSVIKNAAAEFEKKAKKDTFIALIGGHAVIYYGVERTTLDIDACFYSLEEMPGRSFYLFLKEHLSKRFKLRFIEASKDPSDPLKHDIIIINDSNNEYPRIDILVARYKWELEGLKIAETSKALSFHVIPVPYLIMMKLQASGRKDDLDVIELLKIMSRGDIEVCKKLAKTIGKDRRFFALFKESGK